MSARAQLALEGTGLDRGDTIRMVCPFCGGGSDSERSLALTHTDDGALLFICHRAHCGASGRLGGSAVGSAGCGVKPVRRATGIPDPELLGPIPDAFAQDIRARWSLACIPPHWQYHCGTGRLVFPVLSPKWECRGKVARAVVPQRGLPKSLNYKEILDQPWQHWAYTKGDRIFVVEDIPSAERLAQAGVGAVALVGTHASDDCVDEMVEVAKGRPIFLALDKDAVGKSFAILDRLSLRARAFVALLPVDIKDMTHGELVSWLNGGY